MKHNQNEWRRVLIHNCELGEGPVWDAQLGRILWVDIPQGYVHEWYVESRRHILNKFPLKIGAIALYKGFELIAATDQGFVTLDLANKTFENIRDPEGHLPNNRFNDGKCDPAGRFWAGTMDDQKGKYGVGALYRLEAERDITKVISDVTCSNGIAWSPDSKIMYFIDSQEQNVRAFDFEIIQGNISNSRIVITIPPSEGIPDGMTIDSEGMLWVAIWGGGKVVRYNPNNGQKLREIILPVSQVTSCTFGGVNDNDLYITTAAIGLDNKQLNEQPLAGSLFVVENMPFKGLETYRWNGACSDDMLAGDKFSG